MLKKAFISILLFYWIFHFVLPLIFYYYYEFFTIYSEQEFNISVFKGFSLNSIVILGSVLIIYFLRFKQKKIEPIYNYSFSFLIISLIIVVIGLVLSGGFDGALSGTLNGTAISYLTLFFDSSTALLVYLFYNKRLKYGILILILYVILMTILGSRSAVILVILAALMLPAFKNEVYLKNKLKVLIAILCIVSPILFYFGTVVRGGIDKEYLFKGIVGRISMVELAAIPIEGKDTGFMDKILFEEKYGIANQFAQSVNEISPIDPFKYDINPNQYYRAIFKGAREENAIDRYMSINLTFPTYLYMETNFFFACLLGILILVGIYWFLENNKNSPYFVIVILLNLYTLLYYFDWVMITGLIFKSSLTMFLLTYYNRFMEIMVRSFRFLIKRKTIHEAS